MAEVKCRLCKGETNEPDGICRVCKLFRKEEVAALNITPPSPSYIKRGTEGALRGEKGMLTNKEEVMPEKKKYPKAKCEVEGCEKIAWKDRCCMVHFKEKHGIPLGRILKSQVSLNRKNKAVSSAKSAAEGGSVVEPEKDNSSQPITPPSPSYIKRGTEGALRGEQRGVIDNRKTAALAQLLYASDLLDGQLNNAISNGIIDTKTILDIRFRLGAILRGNIIPPAEVSA